MFLLSFPNPVFSGAYLSLQIVSLTTQTLICLSHLGYEDEDFTDCELVPQVRNVDIIVGGHSHTHLKDKTVLKDLDGEDVVVITDWKFGREIGNLKIDF